MDKRIGIFDKATLLNLPFTLVLLRYCKEEKIQKTLQIIRRIQRV